MIDWDIVLMLAVTGSIIGFLVLGYFVSNNKLKGTLRRSLHGLYFFIWACIPGAILIASVNYYFTESGWYPRTREVNVYFKAQEWVNGELRTCYSFSPSDQKTADDELAALFCGTNRDESHLLRVRFWGPIGADKDRTWKCERETSSITCKLQ